MGRDAKAIGARIRRARESLGRNRNQMARDLGTSWQHVDRWEKGRTVPAPESLRRLAAYLGVSADHLLSEPGSPAQGAGSAGFAEFLRSYAPSDLSEGERAWLQSAPMGPDATPGRYVDLLHAVRSGGAPIVRVGEPAPERAAPARSGTHVKVERGLLLDRLGVGEGERDR